MDLSESVGLDLPDAPKTRRGRPPKESIEAEVRSEFVYIKLQHAVNVDNKFRDYFSTLDGFVITFNERYHAFRVTKPGFKKAKFVNMNNVISFEES